MYRVHLWGRIKKFLEVMGRDACVAVDKMYVHFLCFAVINVADSQ